MEIRARQRTGSRVFGVVFKIGDLIANRYKVSDIIGSGGAGVVYKAHDQEIDVDVAVKVINAKLVQTADEQRLFSRQTKIARKLSHQNVVRIYDEGRDEDRPFYTMQFLEGLSLRKIIDLRKEKQQTFALAEIEPIYNQLCQALDYAHKTTFHGDLKPDNVIVLPDLLKVTDFALLRGLPRKPFLAIQKSRAANFRYLAPEVRLEVNELDRQVDIYSLGVILSEMLTGNIYDDAKPDQLALTTSGLDPSILSVVKRAVARAPRDRYLSAIDLYDDLKSVLSRGVPKTAIRIPPTSGNPPQLAEAPTQRLDISRHGPRPIRDGSAPRPEDMNAAEARRAEAAHEEATKDARPADVAPRPAAVEAAPKPAAVEVAKSIEVPDSPRLNAPHEQSGTFANIDDDMIESALPSGTQELPPSSDLGADLEIARAKAGPGKNHRAAPAQAHPDHEHEEEGTLAEPEEVPMESVLELDEISNSAIELIADPRKTGLIRIEVTEATEAEARAPEEAPSEPPAAAAGAAPNRTVRPTPLPDSALPAPAFAQAGSVAVGSDRPAPSAPLERIPPHVAAQSVEQASNCAGARDGGGAEARANEVRVTGATAGSPMGPQIVVRGTPAPNDAVLPGPQAPAPPDEGHARNIPRSPTLAMEIAEAPPPSTNGSAKHKNGKAKPRPMTRPRMSALPVSPSQVVVSSPVARKATGIPFAPADVVDLTPSPEVVPALAAKSAKVEGALRSHAVPARSPAVRAPAGAAGATSSRTLALTVILSLLVLAAALLVIFKVQSDHEKELAGLQQQLAQVAQERQAKEEAALAEEQKKAALAAAAAKQAEAKRLEAEKAAKEREAALADAAKKDEKKPLAGALAVATRTRSESDIEAKREKARDEKERKKREREEQAALAGEKKAKAEEKAVLASKQKADREEASRVKHEQEASKKADEKAALELKRAEEKRRAEEARAAEDAKKSGRSKDVAEEKKSKQNEELALATPLAAASGAGGKQCPKGMVLIEAGAFMLGSPRNDPERNFGDLTYQSVEVGAFCVDYYEFPNGRGRVPTTAVSFKAAQTQCKKKGKRLCSENEWEKACKGPSGTRFPYGNQWDPSACATEDDEGNKREITKSGEFKRCRSGFNVFDLSGNVAEWTMTEYGQGGYVVKGGSADRPGYDGRCAARKKKKGGDADALLGFRCCSDPS